MEFRIFDVLDGKGDLRPAFFFGGGGWGGRGIEEVWAWDGGFTLGGM